MADLSLHYINGSDHFFCCCIEWPPLPACQSDPPRSSVLASDLAPDPLLRLETLQLCQTEHEKETAPPQEIERHRPVYSYLKEPVFVFRGAAQRGGGGATSSCRIESGACGGPGCTLQSVALTI